jgi:pyrimidine deaminase RibD-like protein
VVGEGWHEYDLLDHAEVVALKEAQQHAGERVKGGTVYVTLEPCNHQGRTGPCTQALIGAGVATGGDCDFEIRIQRWRGMARMRCGRREFKLRWAYTRRRRGG